MVNLAWVYVHCDIYETYVVGWGQSAIGICALCYIYLQVCCSSMQGFYV